MAHSHDLSRFLDAQKDIYEQVLFELKTGQKRSHWMWFIFPQIQGLGSSSTAKHYAIQDADEALSYYRHPDLGERLKECTRILLKIENPDVDYIFGYPDNLKFKSSLTLFSAATSDPIFEQGLDHFFHGVRDEQTLQILAEK